MSRVSSQLLDELFDSYDIESLWLPHQRVIATMFQTGKSLDDVNDMLVKLAEIVDDPEYGTTKYANIFEPA